MSKPYFCRNFFLTDWRHKHLKNKIDLLVFYREHFHGISESVLIFFISDLIRDKKICILLSTYFSALMRSNMALTSNFNFPFVTSTPFSMCFAVDVETTHSKRILSIFELLNLINEKIKFFGLFLYIFFEDGKPTTANAAHFGLLLF